MRKILLLISLVMGMSCWKANADSKPALEDINKALVWIDFFYVDTVNCGQLAETAIRSMLKELDPHSTYLASDEVRSMQEDLGGKFEGIGVRFQMERDTLIVINTVAGGPSEKMGIMTGDRIISVNDTTIAGVKMSNRDIQRRLRGPKNSHVKIGIKRDGVKGIIDFNIVRDRIPVYSIDASYMIKPGLGYIKVSRFAETTPVELQNSMETLTKRGMKDVIIDLQNNGGGYLKSAVDMATMFLPSNQPVVYTEGRTDHRRTYKTGPIALNHFDGRVIVLVDEETASASEIFAGAIQDLDRGVIVGRRTFGKGLVQRPIELPSGAMLRLTIAHYYTPSGRCIQKPYTKGNHDDYEKDLKNRADNGEMTSANNIHFEDSLKYQTKAGRTVYGGGGIMPDVFVPLDTARMTPTHRTLIARGTFNRYVLEYFKEHQKEFKKIYKSFEDFNGDFEVTQGMLDTLCLRGVADSITIDPLDLEKSSPLMKLQLKAGIAADLFDAGSYMRVMNERNDIFLRGIDLLSNEEEYRKLLSAF